MIHFYYLSLLSNEIKLETRLFRHRREDTVKCFLQKASQISSQRISATASIRKATQECYVSKASQLQLHKSHFCFGALHSALLGDRKKELSIGMISRSVG